KRDVAAGTFSKGMKQKLAIARALIHDPQVLCMDEPTANLDPESAKTVREFILDLKKEKRTIFLNTHNLDEAQRVCDKIAILNTKLMATGTPEELEGIVGTRRVVIQVEKMSEGILAAVRRIIPESRVMVDGLKLTVELAGADGRTPDIVQAVVQAGGRVRFAGVEGSTLEDTYLKLVRREQ
ncbi:MAG TPA: ABC transporter ATP-binding protein, partial [Nitrososphaerales archaeon]|nr:ABC transporter ATP-binding protein [Nitrososphaerales archaeon]